MKKSKSGSKKNPEARGKKKKPSPCPALTLDHPEEIDGTDFTLRTDKGHCTAWITVKNLSVYIVARDKVASVSVYPKGCEDENAITETTTYYSQGRARLKERKLAMLARK